MRMMQWRRYPTIILFLILFAPVFVGEASANGRPVKLVDGEPVGILIASQDPTKVGVVEEQISFDFRTGGPRVTVRYVLSNPMTGDEQLRVAFITVGNASDFSAKWNDKSLKINPGIDSGQAEQHPVNLSGTYLPIELHWLNPRTGKAYPTPEFASYVQQETTLFELDVAGLSTGELVISFYQGSSGNELGTFFFHGRRHYTYLLTPARYWAFFRQLTITVYKPDNMWVATEPRLAKLDANTFEETFDGLPEGNLHLSTQLKGLHFTGRDLVFLGTLGAIILIALGVAFLRRKFGAVHMK